MSIVRFALGGVLVWYSACAGAQVGVGTNHVLATPVIAPEVAAVVTEMASQAGVIFAGHVAAVVRDDGRGLVEVRFAVDEPIRGGAGPFYTLREWVGRWLGRTDRYVVGQRFLMMLSAPGPQGLSAPVSGEDGAIPLVGTSLGPVLKADGTVTADSGSTAMAVDLRRLAARASRRVGAAVQADGLPAAGVVWAGPAAPLLVDGDGGTTLLPPMSVVLGLLGAVYVAR